jgi:hypothetical protein
LGKDSAERDTGLKKNTLPQIHFFNKIIKFHQTFSFVGESVGTVLSTGCRFNVPLQMYRQLR